jgi:DnaJ-class molecular chaperone
MNMKPFFKKDLDPQGYGLTMPDSKVIFDSSKFDPCPNCYPSGHIIQAGKKVACPTCHGTTAVPKNTIVVLTKKH